MNGPSWEETYRAYRGHVQARVDAKRVDALEREQLAPLGECVCYGSPRDGEVTCMRVGCVRGDENGPRAFTEPCNPDEDPDMTNTDADDANDPVTKARAERDEKAANAWRTDEKTTATRAMRDRLRSAFGDDSITDTDVRELVAARGGDSNLAPVVENEPDTIRALLHTVRKKRSAPTTSTNTDANDHGPIDVEASRQARDLRAANAWKT